MTKFGVRVVVGLAGAALCSTAAAEISNTVFTIHAESNGMNASWSATADNGWWDGDTYYWDMGSPVEIRDDVTGTLLGTLNQASITFIADPVVEVNIAVQSGATQSAFTIDSGLLSFPTYTGVDGTASAGLTVTDVNGDGATLTPNGAGSYLSQYNGAVPGGTTFADLLPSAITANPFSTTTVSDESAPGGAFTPIAGAVSDMSARWQFSLSPFDIASGTSTYVITPAPSSLALLGLGGLIVGRRRR